jgi:hypothetical protein
LGETAVESVRTFLERRLAMRIARIAAVVVMHPYTAVFIVAAVAADVLSTR